MDTMDTVVLQERLEQLSLMLQRQRQLILFAVVDLGTVADKLQSMVDAMDCGYTLAELFDNGEISAEQFNALGGYQTDGLALSEQVELLRSLIAQARAIKYGA